jgi:prevent-host-death family protein
MTMSRDSSRRTISAADFKARCLALLDQVDASGDEIVVTKRGRAVARLVPIRAKPKSMRGSVRVLGDIVAPIDGEWESMK